MLSPFDPGLQCVSQDVELVTRDERVRLGPCASVALSMNRVARSLISEERHILWFSILTLFTQQGSSYRLLLSREEIERKACQGRVFSPRSASCRLTRQLSCKPRELFAPGCLQSRAQFPCARARPLCSLLAQAGMGQPLGSTKIT